MLKPSSSKQFNKDVKKQKKRGKDLGKIKIIMSLLVDEKKLPEKCVDHKLAGDYTGYRDCHIEPDWIVIYKINKSESEIVFVRTGSHSDLFK